MTFPAERIGDKGQRFEVSIFGYPEDNWFVIGWAPTHDSAVKFGSGFRSAPGAAKMRIVDREDVNPDFVVDFSQQSILATSLAVI